MLTIQSLLVQPRVSIKMPSGIELVSFVGAMPRRTSGMALASAVRASAERTKSVSGGGGDGRGAHESECARASA